jgi:hypothetical protein
MGFTMCVFWRSAIVLVFITIGVCSVSHAACNSGDEGCEPSQSEVHAKVEQLLNSAFLTPHSIISLEKFNGRSVKTQGEKKFEMRFFATVSYSDDKLRCRRNLCPELHNYLLEVDAVKKRANIAGWLFFERADRGWR